MYLSFFKKKFFKVTLSYLSLVLLLFFLLLLFFYVKLLWLFPFVFFFSFIIVIVSKIKKSFLKLTSLFISFFLLLIVVRLFLFDVFIVPSSSMENTLFPNDIILVNKLKYGPKLPCSPFDIPLINFIFYLNKNAKERIKDDWWSYKRLSGYDLPKRGDIIVYENFRKNYFFVKRCVGVSADTIQIKKGDIYINNKPIKFSNLIKNNFRFVLKDEDQFSKSLDSLEIDNYVINKKDSVFYSILNIPLTTAKKLNKLQSVTSYSFEERKITDKKKFLIQPNKENWTIDNLGHLIIPKKGMQITLTDKNIAIYKRTLRKYEKVKLKKVKNDYFINNKKVNTYKFKQNYFFMMGDNRHETFDSRFFGFLPESNIVGFVNGVVFSNYKDTFQWERLFKNIYQ